MAYADFGSGFLSVLDKASSMQKNADYNSYRKGSLKLAEEENKRQQELQAGKLEKQKLDIQTSRITAEDAQDKQYENQKASSYVGAWADLESMNDFVTDGTEGKTFDFDIDGILDDGKQQVIQIFNADYKYNIGKGTGGELIANEITDFQYVDDLNRPTTRADATGVVFTNKRVDGSSEGPVTVGTTADNADPIERMDMETFRKITTNALSDSYAIGRFNVNTQYEKMTDLENAMVRVAVQEEAQQKMNVGADPSKYRQFQVQVKAADTNELDQLAGFLKLDAQAIRNAATEKAKSLQDTPKDTAVQTEPDAALVSELDSLRSTDDNGKVTFSDPKRAQQILNDLKKQGADPEVKKLVNSEGRKQQTDKAQSFTEIAGEQAEAALQWAKENPVDAALMVGSGLLLLNPAGLAVRGGAAVLRGAPKALEWIAKKALTRKKSTPSAPSTPKGGAVKQSREEIIATQNKRRAEEVFGKPPEKPAKPPGRYDDLEISPTKAGVISAGALAYRQTADEAEQQAPSEAEVETGIAPTFRFNSDDALRDAIMNEASDPDSEVTKQFLQSRGINASNFNTEVRKLPTEEQYRAIFAVAKNANIPIKEQLELVNKLSNQFVTGSQDVNFDQMQDTAIAAQNAYTSERAEDRQERQRVDGNIKDNRTAADKRKDAMNESQTSLKDIRDFYTNPEGGYTLDNQQKALNATSLLWGKAANATSEGEYRAYQNAAMEAIMTDMQAVNEQGGADFFNFGDRWDDFFNKNAKMRAGVVPAQRLLRAEIKDGKVTGIYFRDPATTSKRLDFGGSISNLRRRYDAGIVEQIVNLAYKNTADEQQLQSEKNKGK
jgi:hypothetical protein